MQKIMGWAPSAVIGGEGKDAKEKKSLKRRSDGASVGPGKAWRKGLKKWVATEGHSSVCKR